jgi:hypothetical protein
MTVTAVLAIILVVLVALRAVAASRSTSGSDEGRRDLEPPAPRYSGLFAPTAAETETESRRIERATRREGILRSASSGDVTALERAIEAGGTTLYGEALEALVRRADGDPEVYSRIVAVLRGDASLRGRSELTRLARSRWIASPSRRSLVEFLHLAAIADDAERLDDAVSDVVDFVRRNGPAHVTADDLVDLCNAEFWTLAPEARNSGSASALKRRLASLRRELATSPGLVPQSQSDSAARPDAGNRGKA